MTPLIVKSDGCTGTAELQVPELFDIGDVYVWTIVEQPPGANATLASPNGTTNIITMPIPGCYKVQVIGSGV